MFVDRILGTSKAFWFQKGRINMIHEMKLQPKYYDYILNGTKRIEIRLNDEKRKQIRRRKSTSS